MALRLKQSKDNQRSRVGSLVLRDRSVESSTDKTAIWSEDAGEMAMHSIKGGLHVDGDGLMQGEGST